MVRSFRLYCHQLEQRIALAADVYRIVSYNIASSTGTTNPGLDLVLQGIGSEVIAGNAQPIDAILLQEVEEQLTTSQAVVNILNTLYGAGTYSRGALNGASTGSGTQGIVYRNSRLQLIAEASVGVTSSSGMPRAAVRHRLRPVGSTAANDIYIYNSHAKADTGTTNENRRAIEASTLRTDADALGSVNIIYAGDFNTYDSSEPFFTNIYSAGNGQAFDPINRPGNWSNNNTFRDIFTQAPSSSPPDGFTGGGLDDRFDFLLHSNELTNNSGIDYIAGTYHTFGNNGSVNANGNINAATSTALPGMANRTAILNALVTASDHLPVVADYRLLTPPTVTVQTDNGTAQRSMVRSFTVTFSSAVSFPSGLAAAFTLQRSGPATPTGTVPLSFSQAGNTITISFPTGTFAPDASKSLIDGLYTLTLNAANISSPGGNLDGNGDGIGGDNRIVNTHRLLGDSDGDRDVDNSDFATFRTAFGNGPSIFDSDGDGDTDNADFTNFRTRFGTTI